MVAQQATISRFNKMKLTNSNTSILRKLDELGENHDAELVQAKQQISNQNTDLNRAQEKCNAALLKHSSHTHCSSECRDEIQSARREKYELKKAAHPGFVISFDNLDIHLERKNNDNGVTEPRLSLGESSDG